MTENKRFTTVEMPVPTVWGIWSDGEYLSTSQVCTLLNELSEENEQLKSRCDDYDVALKALQDLTDKKLKENEQLKSEIKDFQDLLGNKEEELLKPILRMIDDKIEEIRPYNSELCRMTLVELRKEITDND